MLAVNFHKTFIPERRLIAQLLRYAALGKEGSYGEISAETGIPMGKSSGKVPAIIDYARGMGLIVLGKPGKKEAKRPVLTDLGRVVYTVDPYLSEPLTQWVLHLNLCRPDIGAQQWHLCFAKGTDVLGLEFTESQLEKLLQDHLGRGRNHSGLVVNTYIDDAALARARVLKKSSENKSNSMVRRQKAPLDEIYASAYAAFILEAMEAFFPEQMQVSVEDFDRATGWTNVCGWNKSELGTVLEKIQRTGMLAVDRQLRNWILDKRATAKMAWERMYEGLV